MIICLVRKSANVFFCKNGSVDMTLTSIVNIKPWPIGLDIIIKSFTENSFFFYKRTMFVFWNWPIFIIQYSFSTWVKFVMFRRCDEYVYKVIIGLKLIQWSEVIVCVLMVTKWSGNCDTIFLSWLTIGKFKIKSGNSE